ncbi:MAG: hypothetical protein HDKAJFGB_02702 [Anaerolineae bacterium]|nr:hypothetical protein [Anaerolineae bacterium]MDL1895324.1 hypothetical protein [Anaerolineae bacterium CFX7]
MTILVETTVPESGRLALHLDAEVQINISAPKAQQRVTRFVHAQVSSQMHGALPQLVLKERAYWQVPVQLTLPSIGDVGSVGMISVDVETGELLTTPEILANLANNAEQLAFRFAALTTR